MVTIDSNGTQKEGSVAFGLTLSTHAQSHFPARRFNYYDGRLSQYRREPFCFYEYHSGSERDLILVPPSLLRYHYNYVFFGLLWVCA